MVTVIESKSTGRAATVDDEPDPPDRSDPIELIRTGPSLELLPTDVLNVILSTLKNMDPKSEYSTYPACDGRWSNRNKRHECRGHDSPACFKTCVLNLRLVYKTLCRDLDPWLCQLCLRQCEVPSNEEGWEICCTRDGGIAVNLTHDGLQKLAIFAKFPAITDEIEVLHFSVERYLHCCLEALADQCSKCEEMYLDDEGEMSMEHTNPRCIDHGSEYLRHLQYQQLLQEQEWMLATGTDRSMLQSILSRFKNLKEVYIGTWCGAYSHWRKHLCGHNKWLHASEELPDLDWVCLAYNTKLEHPPEQVQTESMCHAVSIVLEALKVNSIELGLLLIDQIDGMKASSGTTGMWAFKNITGSANLRDLRLVANYGENGGAPADWIDASEDEDAIVQFISHARHLEVISLMAATYSHFGPNFIT